MHYHIILTENCNLRCRYCYEKSFAEFDNGLDEKFKFDSELARKTKQEISDIDKRIERLEKNISEKKGIENIQKAEISELEKRKEKLEKLNQESKISVKSKLISLNFIYLHG